MTAKGTPSAQDGWAASVRHLDDARRRAYGSKPVLMTAGDLGCVEVDGELRYADGGGFNNALSSLRTLGLISGRGVIELHEDLR